MDLSSNFRIFAFYNQRMNVPLMGVCYQLTNSQLHQKTNSFSPTAIAHWIHFLFSNLIMLQRLDTNNLVSVDTKELSKLSISMSASNTFVSDLVELAQLRKMFHSIYINITNQFTADIYNQIVWFVTTEKQIIERTRGGFFQHLSNHQNTIEDR